MKIRTGFVSNSSSSSFCIYGTLISKDMLTSSFDDFKSLFDPKDQTWVKEALINDDDVGEVADSLAEKTGLETHYLPEYYEEVTVMGRSWSNIKDNETGKQFKDSITESLKKLFGDKIKCNTHEECWRDG